MKKIYDISQIDERMLRYANAYIKQVVNNGQGGRIRTYGLRCHNPPYNFFLSIYRYFLHFSLQTKYSLTILFPLYPLIPNLSMGYYLVVKMNSVSKFFILTYGVAYISVFVISRAS